ncbi:MAG: peroxiredoxin [Acidobacteriota bacterium]
MSLQIGDRIPDATLFRRNDEGIRAIPARDVFAGRRVVVFALPGAFTPTCSDTHLPGFVMHGAEIKAKAKAAAIVCLAVNDAHVMNAWSRVNHAEAIEMVSDGNGEFTRAAGLTLDLSGTGLGIRSQRYAAVIDDGVVERLWVEPARGVTVSGAEAVLAAL